MNGLWLDWERDKIALWCNNKKAKIFPAHSLPCDPPYFLYPLEFSSVQFSHSVVCYSVTPWTIAHQGSLSITNSRSLLKLMSIESVMPSNHLILCHPLLLLLQSFPASGSFQMSQFFTSDGQKYWSFSFNISPFNECSGLISFSMDWLDVFAVQGTSRVFSNTTVQKNQFFGAQLSL